ncbi:MAG: hypothetical protein GWN01_01930 [Nitrosopumilaceae archaeon]|nr:hypothetical protein [Nitrosopumilaceae archaeon]NIT99732.1 hypothetical protein [Nitrosopumilaceae archaeon]NIU88594.1 hypothetical protein [Nitrosopumilaceae archaeon]NIV64868.1 hypothetical protein [Nitrosopumilaceae archaeon]NIX60335.1 hypothetical protein [Nitrosopumilaceae archaeon]
MELLPEEISEISESPLTRFYSTFNSNYTKKDYEIKLKKVMCEFLSKVLKGDPSKVEKELQTPKKKKPGAVRNFPVADFEDRVNEFVEKSKNDQKWCESTIFALINKLKERSELDPSHPDYIKSDSIKNYFFPLEKLLEMNDISLNFKRIRRYLPRQLNNDDTRGYTRKEIEKIVEKSRLEDKVLVLMASCSGIRSGAFVLKWKHIIPVYEFEGKLLWSEEDVTESVEKKGKVVCGLIDIYADSTERYFAFITPECWKYIQEYKVEWTSKFGKEPRPDDPFFKQKSDFIKPLSENGIRVRMIRILEKSGFRKPLPKNKRRHQIPPFNGFRRFFNKANKQALSQTSTLAQLILKENMMGHYGLIKLDRNYFKAHIDELIKEYVSAIPFLTISDTEQQKLKIKELKNKNLELQHKDSTIEEMRKTIEFLKKENTDRKDQYQNLKKGLRDLVREYNQ